MNEKLFVHEGERVDDLQISGLSIIQDPKAFCFGMDAVLLSGFVKVKAGESVLDMCTGNGILPLLLSAKTKASRICGIEIQEKSAELAARNVAMNGLEERVQIVCGDIKEAGAFFKPASFDVVSCNPPYIPGGRGLKNPDDVKNIARHEILCDFDDVCAAAALMLKNGGRLNLVHRPERTAELICSLSAHKLECKRLRFVHPYVDREPAMVLIEAVKGGGTGCRVDKPLIIYESEGVYSAEIREDYGF
ncbi:MAG: tRNA1(Val) (adenine(37)-N6)-methyltransferase [Lachnospiraceae bacterium]|nr:tRNA1(Val) (adenine(37)-N6)-methyltransferase [Lachnospiraceae bacterium]